MIYIPAKILVSLHKTLHGSTASISGMKQLFWHMEKCNSIFQSEDYHEILIFYQVNRKDFEIQFVKGQSSYSFMLRKKNE